MNCPLCRVSGSEFHSREFLQCPRCRGIYRHRDFYLSRQAEEERYHLHENDVDDPGYRTFVSPITDYVLEHFSAADDGLDFGAGPGPVISAMLNEHGFQPTEYDPFFANNTEALEQQYDYIFCCEVIEHFHDVRGEFRRLAAMLRPGGRLICMTELHHDDIDFATWHYMRHPTHVFFYRPETVRIIAEDFGFSTNFTIEERLIVWQKRA